MVGLGQMFGTTLSLFVSGLFHFVAGDDAFVHIALRIYRPS